MIRALRTLAVAIAVTLPSLALPSLTLLRPASAQTPAPVALPPGVFAAERDIALATAGSYALDEGHTAVIARVSHLGYSHSVFRFDRAKGALTWNPAAIETSKLEASVETASITSNVKGFAELLAGDGFLKSKEFPQATFVSTAFRPSTRPAARSRGSSR